MLVAVVRAGWLEGRKTVETGVLEQAGHGAAPKAQCLGDLAVGLPLPATCQNVLHNGL